MPDVDWIMNNCHMMRDNGVWGGEKQISYASPDGEYTYYVNKRKDGTYYLHGASRHYGGIDMTDNVNKPSHYQGRFGMESIDALRNFMTDEQLKGFYLGNALKYLLRHQKKNGLEDLKKARKNLDWLIEEMENNNET